MEKKVQSYKHIVLTGTAYEAGVQLGNIFKHDKELIKNLTNPFMGGPRLTEEQHSIASSQLSKYCSGANEEIKGFADAVNANWKDIIYYYTYMQPPKGNCSHIAITQEKSKDGNCYLARNYEFGWGEEPLLIESRIKGAYSSIGFGCQFFGRYDGINEKGLCITTSAGVIQPPYHETGFVFPVVVRAILNQCKSVDEALSLFESMPFADYRNFVILDHQGNAALIEAASGEYKITRAGKKFNRKSVYATNHYENVELKEKFKPMKHSLTRYESIINTIEPKEKKVSKKELKNLLSSNIPEGLCCHYYGDGMGTLWSVIFDATNIEAEICFGAPDVNEWRKFDFKNGTTNNSEGCYEYSAVLPNEAAPNDFWN